MGFLTGALSWAWFVLTTAPSMPLRGWDAPLRYALLALDVIDHGEKMGNYRIFLYLLMTFTAGICAAMGVPETNNPIEKLKWARELYDQQGRPLQAERLINEAIEICQVNSDNSCLSRAYRDYGFFFRSKWEKYYKENGIYDKTATHGNRLLKSEEYFKKAISKFKETREYGAFAYTYLNLGYTCYFMGKH